MWRRRVAPGEAALAVALTPWRRQLAIESSARWLIRGALVACVLASLVLLVGWVVPQPEAELRPWAIELGLAPLMVALALGAWPRSSLQQTAHLDTRLRFGDRLATAWTYRASEQPVMRLQRDDAIARLAQKLPRSELSWRPERPELVALAIGAFTLAFLMLVPSPQQAVLDRQATEQLAVEQAGQRLDTLRDEVAANSALTPDEARQLDELLQQARAELDRTNKQLDAAAALARAQDQLAQMGDPNADLRDEALAAMSETLAAEPQTQSLGNALSHEDAQAAADALSALYAQADQLSEVERQGLARALQRAANVGRGDPRAASALRDAAQALSGGNSPDTALSAASAAMRESIQASRTQSALNATAQRLRDLQAELASGRPLSSYSAGNPDTVRAVGTAIGMDLGAGTPVALSSAGSRTVADPASSEGRGAGYGPSGAASPGANLAGGPAAENVFVPGRPADGPADQDLVENPFTLRGAPRPYRDVLSQYAQSSRDYVDRPDISPAVRDLVKQYFQSLEEGQ